MSASSLKFGTSGLRGLASDLMGPAARQYTAAFLAHLRSTGNAGTGQVFVARDLRPSSHAIAGDCAAAITAAGLVPIDCGIVPTPALALHAAALGGPAIMVTGSHIPADRNGLKFYTPGGEIGKPDEAGILAALTDTPMPANATFTRNEETATIARYRARYDGLLGLNALSAWRIGVFEHSSSARDLLANILQAAGATIVRLGRVEQFVAVDTEAFGDAVFAPLPGWISEHRLDAIVSSDGDGDRPLLIDATSQFVRGDVLGLLAGQLLAADVVVTPVTSNSAIERTGYFPSVARTKVGSPYVIAAIDAAIAAGAARVVGFEANGGTLLGSSVTHNGTTLVPLPTRDAVLPLLAAFGLATQQNLSLAQLVAALPVRAALSGRLEHIPQPKSTQLLADLQRPDYATAYFAPIAAVTGLSTIDGLQFTLANDAMVHYRASGNAPELRCYVEAGTAEQAQTLLAWGLDAAATAMRADP